MALRQAIVSEKEWLKRINRTRNINHLRALVAGATPQQIRCLQCIIVAVVGNEIPIDKRSYKKLQTSRKYSFIKKYFTASKTLGALEEARKLILKIVTDIRLFTANITSST